MIPHAPQQAPATFRGGLTHIAEAWHDDSLRPRIASEVVASWDSILDEWAAASDLPLFARKFKDNRGHLLRHVSGRTIVPTDNGPAHWSLTLAYAGRCPDLGELREILSRDEIPVAMALSAVERQGAHYKCTRGMIDGPNAKGWKVAHIEDVGLGFRGALSAIPIAELVAHFKRFLAPRNMFLVPKEYAGIAETPEFVKVFAERQNPA